MQKVILQQYENEPRKSIGGWDGMEWKSWKRSTVIQLPDHLRAKQSLQHITEGNA